MVRNIIWDVDGTLFDTYPAIARAFCSALKDLGVEAGQDQVERLARVSLSHCVATLADSFHLNPEDIDRTFDQHYDLVHAEDEPPFPGVTAVCEWIIRAGGRNVIVTHRGLEGTTELLAVHRMSHLFAGSITRDDGYPRKPDPAAFLAAMQIHNLPKEETLTVGDRAIDILAGQGAGIFTCLFGVGVVDVNPGLKINTYDELLRFLQLQSG